MVKAACLEHQVMQAVAVEGLEAQAKALVQTQVEMVAHPPFRVPRLATTLVAGADKGPTTMAL